MERDEQRWQLQLEIEKKKLASSGTMGASQKAKRMTNQEQKRGNEEEGNYIFLGLVPPAYEWLITENWQRTAQNLELQKSLTFDEWTQLVAKEL